MGPSDPLTEASPFDVPGGENANGMSSGELSPSMPPAKRRMVPAPRGVGRPASSANTCRRCLGTAKMVGTLGG